MRDVTRHTNMRNQLAVFTALCFVMSSTVLPTFAELHTSMDAGMEEFIPFVDETLDETLRNSDVVFSGDEGVLANPIMSDVQQLPETKKVKVYTVRHGDTLSGLADEYGIDADTIVFNNNVKDGVLTPGQTIYLPPVDGLLYTVTQDRDLAQIAEEYKTNVETMADINDLTTKAKLKAGEHIVIPGKQHIVVLKEKMAADELAEKNRIAEQVRKEQEKRNTLLAEKEKQRIADAKKVPANTTAKKAPAGAVATKAGKKFVWPTQAPVITTSYKSGHPGLDIAYVQGDHTTAIVAAMAGTVVTSQGGWNDGYGNMIIIDHGNGLRTRYAHMRERYVKVGQKVATGETIGWMGNTGNVRGRTGLHLHFEVMIGKNRVNPYSYL